MKIDDTYAEAFDGLYSRIIITARDEIYLRTAALGATALPSTVVGRTEGGIENWLTPDETPDGRPGVLVQVWGPFKEDPANFEYEYSLRIRQGILVVPTTAIFDAANTEKKLDMMNKVGHCGDGYEETVNLYGRDIIAVPLMMGDFLIERYLGYGKGVMGGNVWFLCESMDVAIEAGEKAVDAILNVQGAITPFGICSAGSKVETNYPEIGPTTNHPYCPTLRGKIEDSKVPEGIVSIPEIVINGTTLAVVKDAMRAAINAAEGVKGVREVSAGNYGGKLGKHKIYLKEL
ncbi:formylmethanofuran--tetrahydromethanopterin N-formyltransferase [archaeon]|nr:formylmethanofuran--tetrahydromethanopterin N-formyltransferase [archaeon]